MFLFWYGLYCFFALAMQLALLDPSSKAYKVIRSFDKFLESRQYTTDADGDIVRDYSVNIVKGVRSYTFVTGCLIISSIGLVGLCYNISPTKTLAPFKKSFEKMISNK